MILVLEVRMVTGRDRDKLIWLAERALETAKVAGSDKVEVSAGSDSARLALSEEAEIRGLVRGQEVRSWPMGWEEARWAASGAEMEVRGV